MGDSIYRLVWNNGWRRAGLEAGGDMRHASDAPAVRVVMSAHIMSLRRKGTSGKIGASNLLFAWFGQLASPKSCVLSIRRARQQGANSHVPARSARNLLRTRPCLKSLPGTFTDFILS